MTFSLSRVALATMMFVAGALQVIGRRKSHRRSLQRCFFFRSFEAEKIGTMAALFLVPKNSFFECSRPPPFPLPMLYSRLHIAMQASAQSTNDVPVSLGI